jgi:hypothetical protein
MGYGNPGVRREQKLKRNHEYPPKKADDIGIYFSTPF